MSPNRQPSAATSTVATRPVEADRLSIRTLALQLPHGTRLDPHAHAWPQLVYATHGVMTVETEDGAWVVPSQRAVWIPAGVEHAVETTGSVRMRTLYVRPDLVTSLPGACAVIGVCPLLREVILEGVRSAVLRDDVPAHVRLAAVIVDRLESTPEAPLVLERPRDPRARRVAEVVLSDLAWRGTLADAARGVGASPRTIERLFVSETGLTFGRWRQRARMLHALKRLAEGRSVTATALDVRYHGLSAFIGAFKRTLGDTPTRYWA